MIRMPVRYPCNAGEKGTRLFDIQVEGGKAALIFKESAHHYKVIPWDQLVCMVNTLVQTEKEE